MTVKEIALSAAAVLQADDIAEAIKAYSSSEADTELDSDAETLIKCVNLAAAEISDDFPTLVSVTAVAENGIIPLSALDDVSCVKSVTDKRGGVTAFRVDSLGVKVARDGAYTVTYTQTPREHNLDDEVVLGVGIDANTAAYLAARDYCLITGRADDAAVWDQMYNNAAENRRLRRRATLPRRKFL